MNRVSCHHVYPLVILAFGIMGQTVFLTPPARATEYFVSSASAITAALRFAQPGDVLTMANGTWTNQHIELEGFGTSDNPITLRAETPGQVLLNGRSTLEISGDWLVADGLRFEGGSLSTGHVVQFRGDRGEATNSRLTNSAIIDYNPANEDTRYFWVSLYGQNNRVDNNFFRNQSHSGVTVVVWRNDDGPDHHLIDHNHFADRPLGNGNGFETIRIGTSDHSLSDSFTTVENNLFERTDGEIEIISSKSGNNFHRYNTFRASSGTLTLRHGNSNTVEGNFFLGEGISGSGGVRVIGEDHVLVNNYFQGLDGRADGAISISAGVDGPELTEYFQVKNVVIAHNTIVDVAEAGIKLDHGWGSSGRTLLAENVTVANNVVWSTQDPLFDGNEGTGWHWEANVAFGQSLGSKSGQSGITDVDPELVMAADGLYRPLLGSPLVDGASGGVMGMIAGDMDGQSRVGAFDIGADEFSVDAIVRMPLSEGDVGPNWLASGPPGQGGAGCTFQGCAIQAERYASLNDPNGDGDTWTVQPNATALDGWSIIAPGGEKVDLPQETHDAVALYDLEFSQPGTYTAYYRARGFDGSSDSIYTPQDFDVAPDVNQSISAGGAYAWEVGDAFVVTNSDVGVPLQLRIGKRERLADFDAFVLHLNSGLTPEELDNLFTVLACDYNGDDVVDAGDFAVWRDTLESTTDLAADGSGNGIVDSADYLLWAANFGNSRPNAAFGLAVVPEPHALVSIASLLLVLAIRSKPIRRSRKDLS